VDEGPIARPEALPQNAFVCERPFEDRYVAHVDEGLGARRVVIAGEGEDGVSPVADEAADDGQALRPCCADDEDSRDVLGWHGPQLLATLLSLSRPRVNPWSAGRSQPACGALSRCRRRSLRVHERAASLWWHARLESNQGPPV